MEEDNKKKQNPPKLSHRMALMFQFYTDKKNKKTFCNATAAATAAGVKAKNYATLKVLAHTALKKMKPYIEAWLADAGLSEVALKNRLITGLDVKEKQVVVTKTGETIEFEKPAIEVQRRYLDMSLKVMGLYAPEKVEHSTKDDAGIKIKYNDIPEDMYQTALEFTRFVAAKEIRRLHEQIAAEGIKEIHS